MKILLVEDERDLSKTLKEVLTVSGYNVDCAFNGIEAIESCKRFSYDVIIMDVMMDKMDGITALKTLRDLNNATPVLLLTAKSELEDKLTGFEAGADDYLTKPFQIKELLARIKVLSRRKNAIEKNPTFGNVLFDESTCKMKCNEKEIELTKKEFELMLYFIKNNEKFVTSEKIFSDVWDSNTLAFINVLWVFISNLRKKLQSIDANITIKASRGKGYRIEVL